MNQPNKGVVIDLSKHGGPVYVGRPKGYSARKKYNLDSVDNQETTVVIKVPDNTYSINSSFFLALFGDSIRNAGSAESFFCKFKFECPEIFISKFKDYASRALREKTPIIDDKG